jgi:hypothetical protein
MTVSRHYHPSDSAAQRKIESAMLERVCEKNWQIVAWKEAADALGLPKIWSQVKPDGVWKDDTGTFIVAECFARIDRLKPGQKRKLALDAFKLQSIRNELVDMKRLRCLLVVPEEIGNELRDGSWLSAAIQHSATVTEVRLTAEEVVALREAVAGQRRGQTASTVAGL